MSSGRLSSVVRRLPGELDRWHFAVIVVTAVAILAIIGAAIIGADPGIRWTREAVAGLLAGGAIVILALGTAAVIAASAAARWKSTWRQAQERGDQLLQVIDGTSSVIYLKDREGRFLLV